MALGDIVLTMGIGLLSVLLVGGVVGWYTVPVYNRLVQLEEEAKQAWSNINVLLQRRQDELHRLVGAVQEATGHEANTLNQVIRAREAAADAESPREQAEADQLVQHVMMQLDARTEEYPELSAIENIRELQENVATIEREIAERREAYNQFVTRYNTEVRTIPTAAVAKLGGFDERERFEASDTVLAEVPAAIDAEQPLEERPQAN